MKRVIRENLRKLKKEEATAFGIMDVPGFWDSMSQPPPPSQSTACSFSFHLPMFHFPFSASPSDPSAEAYQGPFPAACLMSLLAMAAPRHGGLLWSLWLLFMHILLDTLLLRPFQHQHCHLFSPHSPRGHLVHYQDFRDLSEDRPRSPPYSYSQAVVFLHC